jgi:hypothetical protein
VNAEQGRFLKKKSKKNKLPKATKSPKTSGKGKGSVTSQLSEVPSAAPIANLDPCLSTKQTECTNGEIECGIYCFLPLFACCQGGSVTSATCDEAFTFFDDNCDAGRF